MADVVIINKVDTADYADILTVRRNIQTVNPKAVILEAASPLFVDHPEVIRGKRVLVVEDGPTLTHGEMNYGAGYVAAQRFGAAELVDPRPFAVNSIAETYAKYSSTGPVLPAMGYGEAQIHDLQQTINNADADLVLVATPIDLRRIIQVNKPIERVRYELQIIGRPTLAEILMDKYGL
jgi:predicted GTPase